MTMRDQIIDVMDQITGTLLQKNAAYGNSAMDPVRIFSSSDSTEQLKVRIDDKLSRLARGKNTDKVPEDTLMDLIGYLVLLVIAQEQENEEEDFGAGEYTSTLVVGPPGSAGRDYQVGDEVTLLNVVSHVPFEHLAPWERGHP